jgi:hypothetical protein
MNKTDPMIIVILLFLSSLSTAILMILRMAIPGSPLLLNVLFFPFSGIIYLSNFLVTQGGILISSPIIFLAGISTTALFLIFLLYKAPKIIVYAGLGFFFFVFLVLVGKYSFIGMGYLFQSTPKAMYESLRTCIEFIIALFLLYIILEGITIPEKGKLHKIKQKLLIFQGHDAP